MASLFATPAHAQIVIVDDTPVDNPGGQTVTSAEGVTQTVNSGDNIELENDTNDNTVITLGGTHINNDGDDEDVVVFVDNGEDDVTINILSTGVLQGVDGVIFYEGDGAVIVNDGLIEGTGEAAEAVVYFDRDADGNLNSLTNNGTITSVGGATVGVDSLLGTDPSSGTVGDEEGIARFRLVNTGTISNTGTDSDADAIHFNGDPGNTGGEDRGCREDDRVNCVVEVDITNSGTISASNDSTSNAAIRSESDAVLRGTIVNEAGGMITAATNAIRINGAHADHDVTITNAGTIDGQAEAGILIGGTGVTVVNEAGGMITGDDEGIRVDGDSITVRLFGDIDVSEDTVPENTVITNAGTISGTADGVLVNDDALGLTLTNESTGMITGNDGIQSATGGTVTNDGTITGADGDGIRFGGTQDATVTLGATSTTGGTSQAVEFAGSGTNTLNITSGATLDGDIQGSDGTSDALILSGMDGATTLSGSGFETLTQSGGNFVLSDTAMGFGDGVTVDGGSLILLGTTAGDATVNDGATFGGTGTVGGNLALADGAELSAGNGGVGTLTTGGNLSLSSGSILAFDLGDPAVPSTSDIVNVGGDLTLDGTLNVSDAGSFGLGVYSLISYGGSLTDNGLLVGVLPDGFEVGQAAVQTAVAGQVNLVITALNTGGDEEVLFFDGADIAPDGIIDGGAGIWDNATTNFTTEDGTENFAWNSSFAIFGGDAGGVVTLGDDIEATGLQFLVDGYEIASGTGTLALTEESSFVRVSDDVTAEISASLVGDGGLNKVEGGTLVLSGDNTYTGDTNIAGGTLVLDGTLTSAISVVSGGTLAGSGSTSEAVTVGVGGAAIAPGLDGTAGTLTLGSLTLAENSVLNYDLGAPDTLGASDRIQVNGDLSLDGLLNTNDIGGFGIGVYRLIDYTGTLTDNGLLINSLPDGIDAEQASIQVSVDGQVNLIIDRAIPAIQFWDGADVDGDGVIDGGSGSWNLTDTNWTDANGEFNAGWNENFAVFGGAAGGTVTVDDAITFTGIQFVTDGYTIAAGTGDLTITEAATAFRTDEGVTATISSSIGGDGGLNKLDAGTLILEGDHTYTGDTVIDGGLLEVNGSIASVVTINAGGSLGGSGTTGGLVVTGTLAPGNSIGTLNVAGDVSFAVGSVLEIEVDPSGASDLVAATGDVTIDGGTVSVLTDTTAFNFLTEYTIVTAGGEVNGQFDDVVTDLAFLTPTLSYLDSSVLLTLRRNDVDFAAIGQTPNEIATGVAIESQINGALGNIIINLDAATARDAFSQIAGEVHPSVRTAMTEENRLVRNAVLGHLTYNKGTSGIWGEAWGYTGNSDGDTNASGLDRDGYGLLVGADVAVGEGSNMGLAVSYSDTDIDLDGRPGSATSNLGSGSVETFSVLGYLSADLFGLNFRAGGGFGWSDVTTLRNVTFGTFSETLSASYDGSVLFGFAEFGYPLDLEGAQLEPYIGLSISEAETDEFLETGGISSLRIAEGIENGSAATLGARFATDAGSSFQLRGNAGYQLNINELVPSATANLQSGGDAFTVLGAGQSRSAAYLQAEASFQLSENASIGISYDGIYGGSSQDHAGVARVTIGF